MDKRKKKKTIAKYFNLCVTAEPILSLLLSSYRMEFGFSHVQYFLKKQENTLNIKHGDLSLKLTNLQSNILDFSGHQNYPSR